MFQRTASLISSMVHLYTQTDKHVWPYCSTGGRPRLNSEKRPWVAFPLWVLHLRPIPMHSRDERWGRSPLLFLFSIFYFQSYRVSGRRVPRRVSRGASFLSLSSFCNGVFKLASGC